MEQLTGDPLFAAFAVGAVLLAGISKGGFGGGIGFVGVLALAQISSPPRAVAIMLPILCVMDLMGAWAYRRDWDRPSMSVLLPGALAGTLIGTLTFRWLDAQAIRFIVGAVAIAFFVDFFRSGGEKAAARVFSRPVGLSLGTLAGFTSFVIHAGLPPVAMYLLPQRLHKRVHVGTIAVLFLIANYAKLLPYWWLGLFTLPNLSTSLILMPLAPIGMFIGLRCNHLIPQRWFVRISYTVLFVLGLRMMYEGIAEYFGG